ncbi:DDE_3 domain-containing protein [Trichonephila clavipes]|nr:DDE_3 domain-containing protein [Trichonephila clavipes]
MEWPARSPDLNPIEHLWDYLGREVAALNPPPRSLHELKQGLLCVWSSLPIPVGSTAQGESWPSQEDFSRPVFFLVVFSNP